ncbi:MAG: DUF1992 domain-containing protein [Desulfobacteraceae bacterium]|nr:MAG: DUF1992 domain-containing protein [Desulfobacteraceae bacterium]
MLGFEKIAEKKISEAIEKGEFDNLPGAGEPLVLEDDSNVPEDLRIAYKILRNADCLPPELQLRREIRQMEDLLSAMQDERDRYRLIKRINFRILKLNMTGKKSPLLEETEIYYTKVLERMWNGEEGSGSSSQGFI